MTDKQPALIVEPPPDPLAALKAELEERRARNRTAAEAAKKAAEEQRLRDEIAYEAAREAAYLKYGVGRVLGGEIRGAGFVVVRWPDQGEYRYFVNRGILKTDKLTEELCAELVMRCLVHPDLAAFKTMCERNPGATVSLANKIIAAMAPKENEEGKE